MPQFRKKPVVIEAYKVMGPTDAAVPTPHWIFAAISNGVIEPSTQGYVLINTLEGQMRADVGDWIIKGVKDELYPCKPDIFEATYESVDLRS